jgi:alpha-amylase
MRDLDLDGLPEVFLAEPGQVVTVTPASGAGIGSWDVRAAWHALAAVLRRRPEAYHETLRAHDAGAVDPTRDPAGDGGAPASIHDIVMVKEEGLSGRLFYDDHERRSGLVRFLAPDVTPESLARADEAELGDFRAGGFTVDHLVPGQVSLSREGTAVGQPLTVTKSIRLGGDRLQPTLIVEVEVHHRGDVPIETRLGLEWSLHLLGGGGNPSAWYDVGGERTAHDGSGAVTAIETIGYGNDWVGVAVEARPSPPADAWWSPIETVSNSESGFERVYQGSGLVFTWPVRLAPGASTRVAVEQTVTVTTDRTATEGGVPA